MENRYDEAGRDSVARFEVTGNPNPIQARKAWEDNETWAAGTLLAFGDKVATIAFGDEKGPALVAGLRVGGPVWVTERWGVLAFADEDGNAIAIRPLDELRDSIFTRIGHERLRFVAVRLVGDSEEKPKEGLTESVHGVGATSLHGVATDRSNDRQRGGAK